MAQRILDKYFIEGGKPAMQSFKSLPLWTLEPPQSLLEACVVANFCEVWLAKHNDDSTETGGLVGINRLTKVQLPTLASLYGAILADVDYVIMGAGMYLSKIFVVVIVMHVSPKRLHIEFYYYILQVSQ